LYWPLAELYKLIKNRYSMKSKIFLALAIISLGAYSCVSPKKLQEAEAKYGQLNGAYADLQGITSITGSNTITFRYGAVGQYVYPNVIQAENYVVSGSTTTNLGGGTGTSDYPYTFPFIAGGLYVGQEGSLVATTIDGSTLTFVSASGFIPGIFQSVSNASTATFIVALK
jgi:hypothetical protein